VFAASIIRAMSKPRVAQQPKRQSSLYLQRLTIQFCGKEGYTKAKRSERDYVKLHLNCSVESSSEIYFSF
jgi:hypothetical protein